MRSKIKRAKNYYLGGIFIGLIGIVVGLTVGRCEANTYVWHDFNTALGSNYPGWTWHGCDPNCVIYTNRGWTSNVGGIYDGSWYPRFHTNDSSPTYAGKADVNFDINPNYRVPGTTGAGLYMYQTSEATTNIVDTFFLNHAGFERLGLIDSTVNRMSMYLKVDNLKPAMFPPGPTTNTSYNFNIGTYLCDDGECKIDGGDGEGTAERNNQHYYHYMSINSGGWIHVLLDQTPQHLRDVSDPFESLDPSTPVSNYYQTFTGMYVQYAGFSSGSTGSIYLTGPGGVAIDEITLYSEAMPQNETSIATLWAGYFPANDWWEIGWNDNSYGEGYYSSSLTYFNITAENNSLRLSYDGGQPVQVDIPVGQYKTSTGAKYVTIDYLDDALKSVIDSIFNTTSTVTFGIDRKFNIAVPDGHTIQYINSGSDGGTKFGFTADSLASQSILSNTTSQGTYTYSTFEVRYSTSPITNENFGSAPLIEPMYCESGTTNRIRRFYPDTRPAGTRFTLPAEVQESGHVYFAVKDVSSVSNGDGHESPTSNIKTIDYLMPADEEDTLAPTAPGGLSVQ